MSRCKIPAELITLQLFSHRLWKSWVIPCWITKLHSLRILSLSTECLFPNWIWGQFLYWSNPEESVSWPILPAVPGPTPLMLQIQEINKHTTWLNKIDAKSDWCPFRYIFGLIWEPVGSWESWPRSIILCRGVIPLVASLWSPGCVVFSQGS